MGDFILVKFRIYPRFASAHAQEQPLGLPGQPHQKLRLLRPSLCILLNCCHYRLSVQQMQTPHQPLHNKCCKAVHCTQLKRERGILRACNSQRPLPTAAATSMRSSPHRCGGHHDNESSRSESHTRIIGFSEGASGQTRRLAE